MHRSPALLCALVLVAATACTTQQDRATTAAQQEPVGSPTPYAPDLDGEDAAAPLTPADLEVGLSELVDYLTTMDAFWYHELWTDLFWGAVDDTCPSLRVHNGMDYWNDRCTAASGVEFRGWTIGFRDGGFEEFPGQTLVNFDWLSGHAVLLLPDGNILENFGDVEHQRRRFEGPGGTTEVWEGFVYGDFYYSGDNAEGTWLQEPVTNETYFRYEDHPAGHRAVALSAELAFLSGPVVAVRLEEFLFSDDPAYCDLEPEGEARLRDREGRWVTVVWDAASKDDPACDGCGLATSADGEVVGEVCADFSPLLAWTGANPWRP